jgi:hypothetical protein
MLRRLVLVLSALFAYSTVAASAQDQAPPPPLPPGLPAAPLAPRSAPATHAAPTQPTPPPVAEQLVSFDPRLAELQWINKRWQLTAGGVLLKDFGRQETEARAALRLLRELGVNQLGHVGTPQPVMEYWLRDGQAPDGLTSGVRVVLLDLATVRAEERQTHWYVRDASRVLFDFGTHADEAQQAAALIRQHGFTRLAQVGRGTPAMTVFLAGGTQTLAAPQHLSVPSTIPPTQIQQTTRPEQNGSPPAAAQPAAPSSASGALTDRVPINWQKTQLRQDGGDIRLVSGEQTLAAFGGSERDAQLALSVLRYYHFSELCLVGHPHPAFSYFLVNGHAPRGLMLGLAQERFKPETLTVQQNGAAWVIGDGNQVLFNFGSRQEEAKESLKAIQQYRFDTLCHVGDSGLKFLVRAE